MINKMLRKLGFLKVQRNNCFNSIEFLGLDGKPYQLKPKDKLSAQDCYGYIDGEHVCSFELMSISGATLKINHFAVTGSSKGKQLGEKCLRGFASIVSTQFPQLSVIDFSLYKASTGSNINKLALARERLLKKLGVSNVLIQQPSNSCKEVVGTWNKSNW